MTFADRPRSATGNAIVGVHWVSPNWFSLMAVPLKRGRSLEESDTRATPKVVVINEEAAKRYFPGEDPLGKVVGVYQGGFNTGATVVGVVGDVRFGTVETPAQPDVYISFGQSTPGRTYVFLRTAGDPAALAGPARAALAEVAPFAPVFEVKLMRERVADATGQARLSAGLLAAFAVMALVLAVMGIYGVMSFAVTQRTREVGIRVALGADRGMVLRLFTGEGLMLCGIGIVLGLAGALLATRVLRTMLYGVVPGDPVTYVAIVAVVGAAALVASWVPARRAAGLDPVRALS
jgi:predicted permease